MRQAGSYVGPDKLRFDFTHTQRLSEDERRRVEDRVNEWILRNDPVRPITTTLDEAQRLGAMALFGEKYGDVVRMVEIGDGSYSRELCGGTHVRSTAEIGLFVLTSEGSSASNVRRIEAVTGPEAVRRVRFHDRVLHEAADLLRAHTEAVPAADRRAAAEDARGREGRARPTARSTSSLARLARGPGRRRAIVLTEVVEAPDAKALLDLADRVKGKLGESAADRARLRAWTAASISWRASRRRSSSAGSRPATIVREAAQVAGGGGGGRDTMAQAGGRDPEKLGDAIAAARAAIEAALA